MGACHSSVKDPRKKPGDDQGDDAPVLRKTVKNYKKEDPPSPGSREKGSAALGGFSSRRLRCRSMRIFESSYSISYRGRPASSLTTVDDWFTALSDCVLRPT